MSLIIISELYEQFKPRSESLSFIIISVYTVQEVKLIS